VATLGTYHLRKVEKMMKNPCEVCLPSKAFSFLYDFTSLAQIPRSKRVSQLTPKTVHLNLK
jgi:hypothetical protein